MLRAQYVLVNPKDSYQVLGPFESLELAQLFRSEHYETLGDYSACRIRGAEWWAEVLKQNFKHMNGELYDWL